MIDIPEDIFRHLSIKAAAQGTNREGHVMVGDEEQSEFENWLGISPNNRYFHNKEFNL